MLKYNSLFSPLLLSLMILSGLACEKEDEISEGAPSVASVMAEWSAPRGKSVEIKFTVNAPAGIQSVTAISQTDRVNIPVTSDTKMADLVYLFTLPAESRLNEKHPVEFEVLDQNNQKSSWKIDVLTIALINTPNTYEFQRNNQSTVDFSGQTERLNMVSAIKSYLGRGDKGEAITAQQLLAAFQNTGNNGGGLFDFASTKQLRDKTFNPDLDIMYYENLFQEVESASQNGVKQISASDGTSGLLLRENNQKTVLVNEKGQEFTQLIEKGLMGSVMLHQIYNTYLTDGRIGPAVENTQNATGTNYTVREHHLDEAYGYFHAPVDFASEWPSNRNSELRFWSNYSNVVDRHLKTNNAIMKAFIQGRTAIVNNDEANLESARNTLYSQLEILTAATAVHYINATLSALNAGLIGEAFHALSEGYAFTRALIFHPNRKINLDAIESILTQDFGPDGNFWQATPQGLQIAKAKLVSAYPSLNAAKDDL